LSFFEQESFSFSRFLPGALLPGPIKYIPKLDSFVTVSSLKNVLKRFNNTGNCPDDNKV
jgi:Bardet-Biedl syndrome 9 protein